MGWVKIDDGFTGHPKVVGLSDKARWFYIEALCYASRYLTDGFLSDSWVGRRSRLARELVDADLWHRTEAGYLVHDYLVYNPSRAEAAAKSNANRIASRIRWASDTDTDVDASRTRGRDGTGRGGDKSKESPAFVAFYDVFPRHVGRRTAAVAFEKALTRAEPTTIIAGAERLAADPNLPADAQFIPHPATWLNRDGWDDDPLPKRNGKVDKAQLILDRVEGVERGRDSSRSSGSDAPSSLPAR